MLSFEASKLRKNIFVPIDGFQFCRYQCVVGKMDHSEDISGLPDIFTQDQKKLLKDPQFQKILKECDKDTVVTLINDYPTQLRGKRCRNSEGYGLKAIYLVTQAWFEANPYLCLVCKGSKKPWELWDSSDMEVPNSAESEDTSKVYEAESVDITELICELRSSESAREKRELEIKPRRQRNNVNGGDSTSSDVEYVPYDAMRRIKEKLQRAGIPLYAFYRYPRDRVDMKEFGKTGERLKDRIWRIFQEETIISPNLASGIYIVEVWHKLCCVSNPRVFDVPIKITNRP